MQTINIAFHLDASKTTNRVCLGHGATLKESIIIGRGVVFQAELNPLMTDRNLSWLTKTFVSDV